MNFSEQTLNEICRHVERMFTAVNQSIKHGKFSVAISGINFISEINDMSKDKLTPEDYEQMERTIKNGINFVKHNTEDNFIPEEVIESLNKLTDL